MEFTNEQQFSSDLPRIENLEYEHLHKDYRWVMLIRNAIGLGVAFFIVLTASLVLANQDLSEYILPLFGLYALMVIFRIVMPFVSYPRKGFALRGHDVIYREGVFFYRWVAVPYDRIQHAEVHADLIERILELSSLRIYTAGGSASDLEIPGLKPDQALSMRSFILKRSAHDEEE